MANPTYAEIMHNLKTTDALYVRGGRYRATYGTATGTATRLPAQYPGDLSTRWFFLHDVDPGIGPMGYVAGADIVIGDRLD